jgi:hypothetical protein
MKRSCRAIATVLKSKLNELSNVETAGGICPRTLPVGNNTSILVQRLAGLTN